MPVKTPLPPPLTAPIAAGASPARRALRNPGEAYRLATSRAPGGLAVPTSLRRSIPADAAVAAAPQHDLRPQSHLALSSAWDSACTLTWQP